MNSQGGTVSVGATVLVGTTVGLAVTVSGSASIVAGGVSLEQAIIHKAATATRAAMIRCLATIPASAIVASPPSRSRSFATRSL